VPGGNHGDCLTAGQWTPRAARGGGGERAQAGRGERARSAAVRGERPDVEDVG